MLKPLPRPIRDLAPLAGLWIAVTAYYVFVVSAGHWTEWSVWSAMYDTQASALLSGHLHLLEPPSRALMALENPWDLANIRYWRWDHSYYQGHLYLYWGMVPAFIAAAVRRLFDLPGVADNALVFGFSIVRLVAGTLLIRDVARAAAHRPPRWVVALAMLIFALANPTPYTLARAAIYEASIMGGAAFMVAGLYLGNRAMTAARDGAAMCWLAAASFGFGLAAGTRLNLSPIAVVLAALAGFWRWRLGDTADRRRLGRLSAAALLPAGAIMLGHLIINQLRFHDWAEFGRRYMMTYPHFKPGLRFLLPDIWAYLFAPPELSCGFPYLQSGWDALRVSVPRWLPITWPPDHYSSEPTTGLLIAAPFCCFALVAPLATIARLRLRRFADPSSTSIWPTRWWAPFAARGSWLWAALAIYVLGAAPLMLVNVTTMRYQQDFASGLQLIAIFASWRLLIAPTRPLLRRAMAWLYAALAVATIVAGVLLGFTGYFKHFQQHNPELYYALRDNLSVCRNR